jgi:hypothetical protein
MLLKTADNGRLRDIPDGVKPRGLAENPHCWQALERLTGPVASVGSSSQGAQCTHTPPHTCPSALAKSTPLFPELRGYQRLEPTASAAAPPGGRPGPRSPQGRVRFLRVGAPGPLPSPMPLPAPAGAPPLSGSSPPSGPLRPDLTWPPAPEERRRVEHGRTRPGREHGVPLSLGGGLTTSIPPAPPRTRPPPRTVPAGPPAAHTRFSNRSPSVFGASLPPSPIRSDLHYPPPQRGPHPLDPLQR